MCLSRRWALQKIWVKCCQDCSVFLWLVVAYINLQQHLCVHVFVWVSSKKQKNPKDHSHSFPWRGVMEGMSWLWVQNLLIAMVMNAVQRICFIWCSWWVPFILDFLKGFYEGHYFDACFCCCLYYHINELSPRCTSKQQYWTWPCRAHINWLQWLMF